LAAQISSTATHFSSYEIFPHGAPWCNPLRTRLPDASFTVWVRVERDSCKDRTVANIYVCALIFFFFFFFHLLIYFYFPIVFGHGNVC